MGRFLHFKVRAGVALKVRSHRSDQTAEMNYLGWMRKRGSTGSKWLPMAGVAIAVLGIGFGAARLARTGRHPAAEKPAAATAPSEGLFSELLNRYGKLFVTLTEKFEAIRTAEIDNERLRRENAQLRLKLESAQFECSARDTAARTKALGARLDEETGAKVGRTLASISYRPPANLTTRQLYTLAVSYLRGDEPEKAAVILSFLTGLEEGGEIYRNARNYLMTGVAWYQVDNYELAKEYFEQVLKLSDSPDNLPYQAQARLWRALSASRRGDKSEAQGWLRELIDHHPEAMEAAWVNPAARQPASASASAQERPHPEKENHEDSQER